MKTRKIRKKKNQSLKEISRLSNQRLNEVVVTTLNKKNLNV